MCCCCYALSTEFRTCHRYTGRCKQISLRNVYDVPSRTEHTVPACLSACLLACCLLVACLRVCLPVACWLLAACCLLPVACHMHTAVCCLRVCLPVACWLLIACCLLLVGCTCCLLLVIEPIVSNFEPNCSLYNHTSNGTVH